MSFLLSAKELKEKKDCLIFDCSYSLTDPVAGRRQYLAGHIPGSQYVAVGEDLCAEPDSGGRHPLPEREIITAKLRAWGVNENSTVICYDQNLGAYATRMWWILRWLGHNDVYVLNGGLNGWKALGLPAENKIPTTRNGNFTIRDPLTRICEIEDITHAYCTLIDAREAKRFLGIEETIDPIAGHIPGAISAPFTDNLKGGYFRPAKELRLRFDELLADQALGKQLVCYCGSGITATHNIFALMQAGFDQPALYPGSWSQWITDPQRPVATEQ